MNGQNQAQNLEPRHAGVYPTSIWDKKRETTAKKIYTGNIAGMF